MFDETSLCVHGLAFAFCAWLCVVGAARGRDRAVASLSTFDHEAAKETTFAEARYGMAAGVTGAAACALLLRTPMGFWGVLVGIAAVMMTAPA